LLSTSSVGEIVDYKGIGSKVGWVPALHWMPAYTTRRFGLDLIAGLSLAAFVIPESLAYASLAQLPPVTGLYCYLVAGIRAIPNTPRNECKIAGAILACWSLVHGLTMLLADGLVGPAKRSDELSDSVVQGLLDGLATKLLALPPGTWVGPPVR
jgi:hypothetical protein